MQGQQVNPRELRNLLTTRFGLDELRNLCLDLRIDYDNLPGTAKSNKVRELIRHCERRERLDELIQACARQQPDAPWGEVAGQAKPPVRPTVPKSAAAGSKISARFGLNYSFASFREFVQQAFSLEELLEFVKENEDFKQLGFQLPQGASHTGVTQKLFGYAKRRDKMRALLEQFQERKPALYAEHEPFIESGQMSINVTLPVQGSDAQLWEAQAKLQGEEFKRQVLQASEQALVQTIK